MTGGSAGSLNSSPSKVEHDAPDEGSDKTCNWKPVSHDAMVAKSLFNSATLSNRKRVNCRATAIMISPHGGFASATPGPTNAHRA